MIAYKNAAQWNLLIFENQMGWLNIRNVQENIVYKKCAKNTFEIVKLMCNKTKHFKI